MKLYIIGNGFDCFHNLPTTYEDFRKYLKEKDEEVYALVNEVYNILNEKSEPNILIGSNEDSYSKLLIWTDFETALGNMDEEYLWEYANNYINTNYDNWTDDDNHIAQRALNNHLIKVTDTLKEYLSSWICSVDIFQAKNRLKLCKQSLFLTFNYTKTLELYYSIPKSNIIHIHGSTDKPMKIITGHNRFLANGNNNFDDIRMIECADMIDAALQNMKKPVESIIECNKEYFKTLSDIKEIYIIGHSLNRIDLPYFKEIKDNVKDNVEWLLFFKDKHDYSKNLKEKKEVFQKLGIDSKKVHFKLIENIIESYDYDPYRLP